MGIGEFKKLKIEIEDRVALVTINQPEVMNSLNEVTIEELERAFHARLVEEDVGAVILTGAGEKAFVAGADIGELAEMDPLGGRLKSIRGHRLMDLIENFPKAVIAAINGFCLGGGCELALACHMRMAAEKAQIGLPEVKLGLIPGYGGTQRLSRLVGKGRAMEMILSGESISAQEALRMGLVNEVVAAGELIPRCRKLAGKILVNGPLAVRYSIEVINSGLEMPLWEATRLEATFFGLSCATRDMKEGTRAFIEKRKPEFEGK
ncbi:enoyl-CoA hydratase-related protein [Acidobacteria bacterium AH-259-D05]|nr:enoyl-CoA hydratase-related protein [Acidobacteria bacterium AH-259-D05]